MYLTIIVQTSLEPIERCIPEKRQPDHHLVQTAPNAQNHCCNSTAGYIYTTDIQWFTHLMLKPSPLDQL